MFDKLDQPEAKKPAGSLLTESYRRPRRQRADHNAPQMHPIDERRMLSQMKLEEFKKRESEVTEFMRSLIKKWSLYCEILKNVLQIVARVSKLLSILSIYFEVIQFSFSKYAFTLF